MQVLRALESGRVHDRGDRRDHRPGARPAEERHVPHDGHRRASTSSAHVAKNLQLSSCRRSSRRSSSAAGSARRPARASTSAKRRRPGPRSSRSIRRRSTYRPKQPARLPALDAARSIEDVGERIKTLFLGKDKVGAVPARRRSARRCSTRREVAPDIAYSIDDVDRAMRWGFGWELGPFEIWDAIGVREVLDAVRRRRGRPPLVDDVLRAGRNRFRDDGVPPAGAGSADSQIRQGSRSGSSAATPARASSTSATACSPSSSIRR